MANRQPLIGGNWKMNLTSAEAEELGSAVLKGLGNDLLAKCEVCLFPPFPYLGAISRLAAEKGVSTGGQDVSAHQNGAYTGQTSASMLLDVGCTSTLVGHSERRHGLGESDSVLNAKVLTAMQAGLDVMLCVGETLEERESGQSEGVVLKQLQEGLQDVSIDDLGQLAIAYEPVWAIGTGRNATPADAQTMHQSIRADLVSRYDVGSANGIRIVYGGSVKPDNAETFFAQPEVDGGRMGGASLQPEDFLDIVRAAASMMDS